MTKLDVFLYALLGLALLTWLSYGLVYFLVGGAAYVGHVEDGHYYVNAHGIITEVSKATYQYTYAHELFALGTWVLAALAAVTLFWRSRQLGRWPGQ